MSHLISLENVSLAFGLDRLLDQVKLQVSKGERICLIGRNGAGKSSLLKVIEGTLQPDSGIVWRDHNLRLARLAQDLPQYATGTVYDFVAEGLAETGKLLAAYHALTHRLADEYTPENLNKLAQLQKAIDTKQGWHFDQNINTVLSRLELDPERLVSELSGGWQRRVALAKALVYSPDLLLLDEPTNHLDIEAIQWLENELMTCNIGLVFITHDRSLLQRLATRIIELDRGQLTSWPGDYANFLRRKEELLSAESKLNSEFDKKLAQEEVWIRQGIKARRTRNEGRVRALEAMRRERSKRREVQGQVSFDIQEVEKSGRLVIEAKNITHGFNNQTLVKNFSINIMRGDHIGLIGPNGVGKSTLLNILLGNLVPEEGSIKQGTRLQIAYFDQLRQALDLEKTVLDNVGEGSETIEINGKSRHVISYLNDFLFTPQRSLTPVKALSGGECNRLLLARLFAKPSNVLVLDEPTNDLDIETLELLEELLSSYQGTILLVSHDRAFLDNVVTSTLVFEGNGKIQEYVGGYQDWLRQRKPAEETRPNVHKSTPVKVTEEKSQQTKKLSHQEKKELENLPKQIEKLEREQQKLHDLISNPEFYQQEASKITEITTQAKKIESDLAAAYKRWEALEELKS
ncbi:MAG: ATP-binding cassette domain-containing protein [Proteobacteria bacterium]|nr:ATP-binding cassette domain-containing protein [Pseudomonadota bacterium]